MFQGSVGIFLDVKFMYMECFHWLKNHTFVFWVTVGKFS